MEALIHQYTELNVPVPKHSVICNDRDDNVWELSSMGPQRQQYDVRNQDKAVKTQNQDISIID